MRETPGTMKLTQRPVHDDSHKRPFLGRLTPAAPANQLPSSRSAPEGVGLPVLLYYRVPVAVGGGEHPDHVVDARAPERSVEPSISEAEHPTVLGHQPVTLAIGRRCHTHDGLVEGEVSGRAVERGVAEGEDATVTGHQPVAVAIGGGCHTDDGLVEDEAPGGAGELSVSEGEDPAVTGHQPVALSVRGAFDAHDGGVECLATHRAVEGSVTEGEDPTVLALS